MEISLPDNKYDIVSEQAQLKNASHYLVWFLFVIKHFPISTRNIFNDSLSYLTFHMPTLGCETGESRVAVFRVTGCKVYNYHLFIYLS
jgi:hypothetical protein